MVQKHVITRDTKEYEQLKVWCLGNIPATELLYYFGRACQIADDIADEDFDRSIRTKYVAELLHIAMVDIPSNDFYRLNQQWYLPLLSNIIMLWEISDELGQSGNINSITYGYVYRNLVELVVHQTALLLGGYEYARKVVKEFHELYYATSKETAFTWAKELLSQRDKQGG